MLAESELAPTVVRKRERYNIGLLDVPQATWSTKPRRGVDDREFLTGAQSMQASDL